MRIRSIYGEALGLEYSNIRHNRHRKGPGYAEYRICRILIHGEDRRFFQRYLKHFVGYAELSDIPESDIPDTTVFKCITGSTTLYMAYDVDSLGIHILIEALISSR